MVIDRMSGSDYIVWVDLEVNLYILVYTSKLLLQILVNYYKNTISISKCLLDKVDCEDY